MGTRGGKVYCVRQISAPRAAILYGLCRSADPILRWNISD